MHVHAKSGTPYSRWVTLVEKEIRTDADESVGVYHSLELHDYVTILALTPEGEVPLVRQYRPAVECVTLELPGGLLDSSEAAHEIASRELFEETGFRVTGPVEALGVLLSDSGRLENRLRCFFTENVHRDPGWRPVERIEPVLLPAGELKTRIAGGDFTHALHIAIVGLAMLQGRI